jgi:hypothetical protein
MSKNNQGKKGKKRSPSDTAYFKRYLAEGRWLKNRAADLEKHVDNHPNDIQAQKSVLTLAASLYRRNKRGILSHNTGEKTAEQKKRAIQDAHKLSMYRHEKPYPERVHHPININYEGVGPTFKEQLKAIKPYVKISR